MNPRQMPNTDTCLTEAQAWWLIAMKLLSRRVLVAGLCYEVKALYLNDTRLHRNISNAMLARIERHLAAFGRSGWYAYPPGTHVNGRAMAALWMALEAEEETLHG